MFKKRRLIWTGSVLFSCLGFLATITSCEKVEAARVGANHIGTFEGSTTYKTMSENGIQPGLFIEIVDDEGRRTEYESEEGIITIPNTKEGAYVTQARLLGKTIYRDQKTGERLETWEENRELILESIQNPSLVTLNSNNLYVMDELLDEEVVINNFVNTSSDFIEVFPNETIFFSIYPDYNYAQFYDEYKNPIGKHLMITGWKSGVGFFGQSEQIVPENARYMKVFIRKGRNWESLAMVNRGEDYLPYEKGRPYKENVLKLDEPIELKGVDKVKDELDLITGELISRVGETVINDQTIHTGTFFREINSNGETLCFEALRINLPFATSQLMSANWKVSGQGYSPTIVDEYYNPHGGYGIFRIKRSRLETEDVKGFKAWLSENPVKILHPLVGEEKVRLLKLISTYQFLLINKSFIQVDGTIPPVITSITIPTKDLSFALDPNQEGEQQFIAPEFEVTNESNAPLTLTLKTFEQTTDVLNDVLPSKYDSWEGLNKQQSKDIALGLVAQSSNDWLNVVDEPHYVSETNNKELGTIKPKGTVGFEIIAHHGQAFSEVLNPSYRLTFVFELLN